MSRVQEGFQWKDTKRTLIVVGAIAIMNTRARNLLACRSQMPGQ